MSILDNLEEHVGKAVSHYWRTRRLQRERQQERGVTDAGLRSAVTGGAQMNGFINLFTKLIIESGIKEQHIFHKGRLELPGFFRPTKEWDLLVVKDGQLIVAIDAKSQVGPSFGNNFNNRTEEAMGSALDLWTAFREGVFNRSRQVFLAELEKVWREVYRVLVPGGRLVCVVGDVCVSRRAFGRHLVFPLHADICVSCRKIGFDNLNPIVWHKIANANYEVTNGSKFLGKPYEPNAIIKNDIEFILMQRKPGGYRKPTNEQRELSKINKKDFNDWFQQIWNIPGASTKHHPAPFPYELASRIVRMFSFVGDTVLDPFCGTGTTMIAALRNGRNSIGIEIEPDYCKMAARQLKAEANTLFSNIKLKFEKVELLPVGQMRVCEDRSLYRIRPARKTLA